MDFFLFIVFSAVYIMVIHFAMGIRKEFDVFQMVGYFVLGGVIGWWFKQYEMGFGIGVVLTLLFY